MTCSFSNQSAGMPHVCDIGDMGLNCRLDEPPSLHLEQKLERLQVTARFGHRFTPSIKPMPAQQNPMRIADFLEALRAAAPPSAA